MQPRRRLLLRDGEPISLQARAYDLLLTLVERRDRLVSKSELLDLVWPGLVVEENNIQVQISALRKLLGADAIATTAGHGYRFTLATTELPGLAQEAGGSPPAPRGLPMERTRFIGREAALAACARLMGEARLLTLTGIGGSGKTRLALELARREADRFADGAWFVDLAPLQDGRQVASAVAGSLGVREEAGTPLLERLAAQLRAKRALVVLDNCEHVLAPVVELVEGLLATCNGLRFVATTREALGIRGEQIYAVGSMTLPASQLPDAVAASEAGRVFVDRARLLLPEFEVDASNASSIAEICRRLDGIPLAIELAAARVTVLSPDEIRSRLDERFRLLTGGNRALPRQQTLLATMQWSYEHLAPREQLLLRMLSVFAGGWTLEAAVALAGASDEYEILETLTALHDKSLLLVERTMGGPPRYRMLETVRQYAQARLVEADEGRSARNAHLAYYVSLAERAGRERSGPKQMTWLARLNDERDNILLAFDHARVAPGGGAAALAMLYGFYTWHGGDYLEAWHRVALEALAHPDAREENLSRSRALFPAACVAYLIGSYDEAFALAQDSVRIARGYDDPLALGEALYPLGIVEIAVDRHAAAREHFIEALALARRAGNVSLIAGVTSGLGELYSQNDELELAEAVYLEALAGYRGCAEDTAIVLCNLARNAIALRQRSKAERYLREAAATASPPYTLQTAHALIRNCAGLAALHQDWTLALTLCGAADAHREQHSLWGNFVDERFWVRDMAPVREAVGAATAEGALAAGRARGFDSMLEQGLVWVNSLPPEA
ncbi:MAG: winged helix-turn-helix domain-containing protein [Casimicrobiaceae bacterium]